MSTILKKLGPPTIKRPLDLKFLPDGVTIIPLSYHFTGTPKDYALVDIDDFNRINLKGSWSLHSSSYRAFKIDKDTRKELRLSNYIMEVPSRSSKKLWVQHLNRDGLDCRKTNMRVIYKSDGVTKSCTGCGERLSIVNFTNNINLDGGKATKCRECLIEYNNQYFRKHERIKGFTKKDYDKLLKLQNNECAICKVMFKHDGAKCDKPHADHNHSTGLMRGLLRYSCNIGLGMFKDDDEFLYNAVKYLREHNI